MFQHNRETIRLSLVEGRRPPWLRQEHMNQLSRADTWLYCRDCHDCYFDNGKRTRGHIPIRCKISSGSDARAGSAGASRAQRWRSEQPEQEPDVDKEILPGPSDAFAKAGEIGALGLVSERTSFGQGVGMDISVDFAL